MWIPSRRLLPLSAYVLWSDWLAVPQGPGFMASSRVVAHSSSGVGVHANVDSECSCRTLSHRGCGSESQSTMVYDDDHHLLLHRHHHHHHHQHDDDDDDDDDGIPRKTRCQWHLLEA